MILTNHGEKRLRKRKGVSKSQAQADFEAALATGLRRKDMKGKFKKHVDWLCIEYQADCVYYQNFLYFFSGDTLITAYSLPQKFRKYL